MSFTLHDMSSEGFEFNANVWNWKAILEIVKEMDILSEGKVRQMGYNAMGVKIDIDDARELDVRMAGNRLVVGGGHARAAEAGMPHGLARRR